MQSHSYSNNKTLNRLPLKTERSCIVCHRRKVRCDKKSPCANCTRTGVLCHYPSSDKLIPRQPKTTISEIATRLLQLERTIVAVSSDRLAADTTEKTTTTRESSPRDEADLVTKSLLEEPGPQSRQESADEILVHNEFSSRYINDVLLCRLLEEEQEIRSVLANPSSLEQDDAKTTPNSPGIRFLGLLSGNTETLAPELNRSLYPSTWQGMQLWHTFVQNVDPLYKVIHVPTDQIRVFSAMNNPDETKPEDISLLFSIYFAAVISLNPNEVESILGQGKTNALERFKLGLERSLIKSDFLESPNLTILQALALFLKTAHACYTGRSTWVIYGLAVRLAQSIGLHRESVKFHISPFNTEVRRRTWWLLAGEEWRAAEEHGIAITNHDFSPGTRFPLNISDNALSPTMTDFPAPSSGWTEMTCLLVIMETNQTMQRLYRMLQSYQASNTVPCEEKRREVVAKTTQFVENILEACNPVIPIQRATIILSRKSLCKLDFVSRQQWQSATVADGGDSKGRTARLATDENLADACKILELKHELMTDEQLRNYRWAGQAYSEYHAVLYILWHLCVRPMTGRVESAWAAVNCAFEHEEDRRLRQESPSAPKWAALVLLREKAARIRDRRGRTEDDVASGKVENSQGVVGADKDTTKSIPDGIVEDMVSWDGGLLDWDNLVQDIGTGEFDFGPA